LNKTTTQQPQKIMKTIEPLTETENIFGPVVYAYTRAQALDDGLLVDVSEVLKPCPFKFPVALSRAAYEATIAAGGQWVAIDNPTTEDLDAGAIEALKLPGGQDIKGRLHDIFSVLLHTINRTAGPADHLWFSVLVDTHGNGRPRKVELYSVCGPGDNREPVITIMLQGED
jgi:hypothetical protein